MLPPFKTRSQVHFLRRFEAFLSHFSTFPTGNKNNPFARQQPQQTKQRPSHDCQSKRAETATKHHTKLQTPPVSKGKTLEQNNAEIVKKNIASMITKRKSLGNISTTSKSPLARSTISKQPQNAPTSREGARQRLKLKKRQQARPTISTKKCQIQIQFRNNFLNPPRPPRGVSTCFRFVICGLGGKCSRAPLFPSWAFRFSAPPSH